MCLEPPFVPPQYELPNVAPADLASRLLQYDAKFSVIESSISAPIVKKHLRFYKAIHEMYLAVDADFVTFTEAGLPTPSPKMRVFLSKAIERYTKWIGEGAKGVPALEVLAVLHAHMIAPWAFQEDMMLRLPQLENVGVFPFDSIDFEKLTWTTDASDTFNVACPKCETSNAIDCTLVAGTTCTGCSLEITHDALCVGKLRDDLVACEKDETKVLSGTLIGNNGPDFATARGIAKTVLEVMGSPADIGERFEWSKLKIAKHLEASETFQALGSRRVGLLTAYNTPGPFCVDLIDRVFRQGKFARDIAARGMLSPVTYNTAAVDNSVKAYQLFHRLSLDPERALAFRFPPPDVDVVWHTHQLLGTQYMKQTLDLVGVFVNHAPAEGIYEAKTVEAAHNTWKELLEGQAIVVA